VLETLTSDGNELVEGGIVGGRRRGYGSHVRTPANR
jgi:hypothetical protein